MIIAPFGYRWLEGHLREHPDEGPVRRTIFDLFRICERYEQLATQLNDAGHRTRESRPFSDVAVKRILRDPLLIEFRKRLAQGIQIDEVVPRELADECAAILERKQERKSTRSTTHLFSGLVVCECGAKMYAKTDTRRYVCKDCGMKVEETALEQYFLRQFQSVLHVPDQTGDPRTYYYIWPHFDLVQKQSVLQKMLDCVVIKTTGVHFTLAGPLSLLNTDNSQQGTETTKERASPQESAKVPKVLKIDVSGRELWHGDENLTHRLNETTKNFLAVLALNFSKHNDVPLDFSRPFDDDATATVRSAVVMLRRQLGPTLCRQLIQTERGRRKKPGGVRLANVEVVGTAKIGIALGIKPWNR